MHLRTRAVGDVGAEDGTLCVASAVALRVLPATLALKSVVRAVARAPGFAR